jgi:hypothetical protein
MKHKVTIFLCAMFLMSTACQSIRENHFFKDKAGNPPNYYKLQIRGHAFLTSSRYLSGRFDEEAVNHYFGEISQPKNVKIESTNASKTTDTGIVPLGIDKGDDGKKFVLLLSTNSDAISSAFGNFVESKATQREIARIFNRDKLIELDKLTVSEEVRNGKMKKLLALGESYLNLISEGETKESIDAKLLAYLNATADYFGKTQDFKNVAEAKKWLDENKQILKSE